jgi:sugar porter (SP) family MFS transporter
VDRPFECLSSLAKLRRLPPDDNRVQLEYQGILAEVEFQKLYQEKMHPGARGLKLEILQWLDLFRKKMWRRVAVGCGVCFFQQFSGINAFIYYAPTLFESIGQSAEMALILSGVFNILQLVAVVVCFIVIDKVGRRPLAIFGGFSSATCYLIISVLSGIYEDDWSANTAAGWAAVAMAFVFILVYGVSYSPLGWALPPEVFPTSCRSKGVALAVAVNWLSNFIIGIAVPPMLDSIKFGTYIFFCSFCFLAGIWAYFLVPETMGKTLEEMDQAFGDNLAAEEAIILQQSVQHARRRSSAVKVDA